MHLMLCIVHSLCTHLYLYYSCFNVMESFVANQQLQFEGARLRRPFDGRIRIAVFHGGHDGNQYTPFRAALNRVSVDVEIDVEFISTEHMRVSNWTPDDLVDRLLMSDIHFILAHVHQGSIKEYWNTESVLKALQ
jgi:hypothetical protein